MPQSGGEKSFHMRKSQHAVSEAGAHMQKVERDLE